MQDLLPEVSIVMPVCNGGETVQAAIESIQHQTFHDWEFIIVDDGSSDNTADIPKRNIIIVRFDGFERFFFMH